MSKQEQAIEAMIRIARDLSLVNDYLGERIEAEKTPEGTPRTLTCCGCPFCEKKPAGTMLDALHSELL